MNKLTLMLYMVGGNLERRGLVYTKMLLQIMRGIAGCKTENVAILAETGGSCLDPQRTVTGGVEDDAGKRYRVLKQNLMDRLAEKAANGSIASAENLARLKVLDRISWDKNERWLIKDHELIPLQNPPGKEGLVLMTEKDEEGNVIELRDLITEAVTSYPAEQYALILCGHGGGPLWGFGEDERNDDDMIISADLCRMMPVIRGLLDGKKLAFVGYNSCRMSHIEAVTAWAEGARAIVASEGDEQGIGWVKEKMIETLLKVCQEYDSEITDDVFDTGVLHKMLDEIYRDLHKREEYVWTALDLREDKIDGFKEAFQEFCRSLAKRYKERPMEMFWLLSGIRDQSQRIDEYSIDLGLWAKNLVNTAFFRDDPSMVRKYEKLEASIRNLTLKRYVSAETFPKDISGISLFFPDSDSTTDNSNFEKYLFSHRVSHKDGFRTWPFHGYAAGLEQPQNREEAQDFCPEYDYLKKGYWELAALYNAMREAGRLKENRENGTEAIRDKINREFFLYGQSSLLSEREKTDLTETIRKDREGVFEQNVVVRYIYEGDEGRYSRNRGLGYLKDVRRGADGQETDGQNTVRREPDRPEAFPREADCPEVFRREPDKPDRGFRWFFAQNGNSEFLIHVYGKEGGDFFEGRVTILTPVLIDHRMYMLAIRFEEGSAIGRVSGYYRYHFPYDRITHYISGDGDLEGKEISFLGSVSEGVRYEMAFEDEAPERFVIGSFLYGKNTAFVRGKMDTAADYGQYETVKVMRYWRDVFGNRMQMRENDLKPAERESLLF
ncbi:clostripain-related cysteine peptidase [[Clostridium] aminophilum]|nr:clostripain-related cysteine peptidase [[Clostridium] aminophilum]